MQTQFYQLARGARFECNGKNWIKTAMSMAEVEGTRDGFGIWGWTEVTPLDDPPKLLSEAEQRLRKPVDLEHWADHMEPSPVGTKEGEEAWLRRKKGLWG